MGKGKSKKKQSKTPKKPQPPLRKETKTTPKNQSASNNLFCDYVYLLRNTKLGLLILCVFLCVLIFLAYLPSIWGAVFLDDYKYILDNQNIKSLSNIPELLENFYIKRGFNQITYAFDYSLFSSNLAGFHFTSISLHVFNALLVWAVFHQLAKLIGYHNHQPFLLPFGFISALFFGLLPINTQPVAYLISRANLIATFFFLVGYWLALLLLRKTNYFYRSWPSKFFIFLGINCVLYLFAFLGLGGKEISATLPAVFLVTLFFISPREKASRVYWELFYFAIPMLLGAIALLWLRWQAFGGTLGIPDMEARSPWVNLLTQFGVIHLYYFSKILFPLHLYLDPVFTEIRSVTDPRFLSSIGIFLGLVGMAFYWRKRFPFVLFAVLWFYITIAPTSSFIPLWDLVAERRVYLPSIGLAFLFEMCLVTLAAGSRRKWAMILLIAVLAYFSFFTVKRNIEYTSAIDLWKHEYRSYPTNARAFYNVLQSYLERDQKEQGKQFFLKSNLDQLDFTYHVNTYIRINHIIKFMLVNQIELQKAVNMAEQLAELMPKNTDVLNTLQTAYLQTNQPEKANEVIDRILKLDPNNSVALQHKALLLSQKQEHQQALQLLEKAARAHPNSLTVHQQLRNYYAFLEKDTTELDKKIETLKEDDFESKTEIDVLLD